VLVFDLLLGRCIIFHKIMSFTMQFEPE
jgi:hypothetical protein